MFKCKQQKPFALLLLLGAVAFLALKCAAAEQQAECCVEAECCLPITEQGQPQKPPYEVEMQAAVQFYANKVWDCKTNGATCHRLNPLRGTCAYTAKGYVCLPGYYEALNGSCVRMEAHKCSVQYLMLNGKNTTVQTCPGCFLDDKPKGGATELGCVDQESTCVSEYDQAKNGCPQHEKRHICAKGYYRTPDNQCRAHPKVQTDKSVAKPGCKSYMQLSCAPNSLHKCVAPGVADADQFCTFAGLQEKAPGAQLRTLLSGNAPKECHDLCRCKPGYVRESDKGQLAPCIPVAECMAKNERKCSGANQQYHECPQFVDYECEQLRLINVDCWPPLEVFKSSQKAQPYLSKDGVPQNNCIDEPACRCAYGFVRLNGQCVDIQACKKYREEHLGRWDGIEAETRKKDCQKGAKL